MGCMKISLLLSLYSVSQQLRENFISLRQRFNPPPTSFCVVTELRSLSYRFTSSFCLAFQLITSRFVLRLYLIARSLLCCMKTSSEDIMIVPLSPPTPLLKLMTNILVFQTLSGGDFNKNCSKIRRVWAVSLFIWYLIDPLDVLRYLARCFFPTQHTVHTSTVQYIENFIKRHQDYQKTKNSTWNE